ncbi:MAG: heavy metal translocating P-type ATPase, partial [Spirochaetota bacterium]
PVVVILAAGIAVLPPLLYPGAQFSDWLYRACVLLVISCPCALVVSVPLGYFGGIGGASRKGILIKGSNYLDVLARVDTVVFDKTGTLTKGEFKVTEVAGENGYSKEEVLRLAADAEFHSNHPIALSIRDAWAGSLDLNAIENYRVIPGRGVSAVINGKTVLAGNDALLHDEGIDHRICCKTGTVVHIVVDRIHAGYIIISDQIKDDAAAAVRSLQRAGIHTVMLTGDNEDAASSAAEALGIDEYHAELLPQDKVSMLEEIMSRRPGKTAFVGDGINDAPVIARADAGIAMGALGSDAAVETADVVLMDDSPSKIWTALRSGKRTRKIVTENIVFALGVKLIFASLGAAGVATMWEAVFADMGVAIIAIFNSMRALR